MSLKARVVFYIEKLLFNPKGIFEHLVVFSLLPLSVLYGFIALLKRALAKKIDLQIPIISVGNLTLGGNGKTPFIISLAKEFDKVYVILRGYARESRGLVEVSKDGTVLCDVAKCGDEAYLIAKSLQSSSVIVCEDRVKAIEFAKQNGAKIVLLDDGFSKAHIKKIDILLESKQLPKYPFCLPSGSYREFEFTKHLADLRLKEELDFQREVRCPLCEDEEFVLITSISKPQRLDEYLPKNVTSKFYFPDHHKFLKSQIQTIMNDFKNHTILCTQKDAVKLENFGYELKVLELEIVITQATIDKIKLLVK